MPKAKHDVLQGTLTLLVLKTLSAGPLHGYAITQHIQTGRRITFDVKPEKGETPVWFEIAGVVGNVRLSAGQAEPVPEVFVLPRDTYWPMARFVLRAEGEPGLLALSVRKAVSRLDPNLVVDEIATLDEQIDLAIADSRVRVRLLGVSLTMIAVAAAASYLPALRAAEVDPGIALRHE